MTKEAPKHLDPVAEGRILDLSTEVIEDIGNITETIYRIYPRQDKFGQATTVLEEFLGSKISIVGAQLLNETPKDQNELEKKLPRYKSLEIKLQNEWKNKAVITMKRKSGRIIVDFSLLQQADESTEDELEYFSLSAEYGVNYSPVTLNRFQIGEYEASIKWEIPLGDYVSLLIMDSLSQCYGDLAQILSDNQPPAET